MVRSFAPGTSSVTDTSWRWLRGKKQSEGRAKANGSGQPSKGTIMNTARQLTPDERKDIYEHIRAFLSNELDVPLEDIGPDTKIIDDLHGDSMIYLELVEEFKKKYD